MLYVEQLNSPSSLESFFVCRLVSLDEKYGLRPTGVENVLGRLGGKAVMILFKTDLAQALGALQMSAEQDAGVEAVVHATCIFSDKNTETVLIINAENDFISINPKVMLHNT